MGGGSRCVGCRLSAWRRVFISGLGGFRTYMCLVSLLSPPRLDPMEVVHQDPPAGCGRVVWWGGWIICEGGREPQESFAFSQVGYRSCVGSGVEGRGGKGGGEEHEGGGGVYRTVGARFETYTRDGPSAPSLPSHGRCAPGSLLRPLWPHFHRQHGLREAEAESLLNVAAIDSAMHRHEAVRPLTPPPRPSVAGSLPLRLFPQHLIVVFFPDVFLSIFFSRTGQILL